MKFTFVPRLMKSITILQIVNVFKLKGKQEMYQLLVSFSVIAVFRFLCVLFV